MGAVDLVLQIESPKSVARGLQRIGRAGHGVGELSVGRIFPKFRGDLLESAVVARRMREGLIEPTVVPRNALDVLAQQIVAIAVAAEGAAPARSERRRPGRTARSRSTSCTRWCGAPTPTPSSHGSCWRTCSTCSTGATPRRSSASCGRGSCGTAWRARSGRARAPASSRSPTPARSPTGACTRSRSRTDGGWASSTRRWSTRRAPGRPSCSAPRAGASRRSAATAWSSRPPPGVPGAVPFWKGDSVGREKELGAAIGAFSRWAVEQDAETLRARVRPRRAGRAQPARVPARAAAGHARAAERAHDRARALPRRDRRLAAVRALPLRGPRARGVGAGAVGAHARALRRGGRRDRRRRRHRPAPARPRRGRHRVAAVGRRAAAAGARRGRAGGRRRARRLGPVRRPLPRERLPRAADPARLPGAPHAAVAAAPEGPEPARGGAPLQRLPDRARDLPGVPAGRPRRARPAGAAARPARPRGLARGGRDAHRLAVRLLAAVRLRGDLHVRGRHAHRRAPGGRAVAGPRPAARAARPGGAARADRPRAPWSGSRTTCSAARR